MNTDRCEQCGSTENLTTLVNSLREERTICADCRTVASALVSAIPNQLRARAAALVAERETA